MRLELPTIRWSLPRTSPHTRMLLAVLAAVALLAADRRALLQPMRATLEIAVYPVQYAVNLPLRAAREWGKWLLDGPALYIENRRLQHDNLLLQASLLKTAALKQENLRLRALLEATSQLNERVLIAELLAVTLAPYEHVVLISKGINAGVYSGQPVIDGKGIVGQVIEASPLNAKVMLITDPNHALPVQVNRNGLRTIAVGSGKTNEILLPNLTHNADVVIGDLLVTSGLGGVFPHGYPVATITHVDRQPNQPFARISATPLAALETGREVLLLWFGADSDQPPDRPPALSSR